MVQLIDIQEPITLDVYAAYSYLRHPVEALREVARETVARLDGRTVWMVNSTAKGGGVAEMLPKLVALMRELGVQTEWVVVGGQNDRFFELTKRLHNMIHGEGEPHLSEEEHALYAVVSRQFADALRPYLAPQDILVVHDPQPLGMGALLKQELGLPSVWRCHIGLDRQTPVTRAVWSFLQPWTEPYDLAVFSVRDYVPDFLTARARIIPPAIDPLSDKNRELPIHKVAGILSNSRLSNAAHRILTPPFDAWAQRLQADGTFAPALEPENLDLMYRPIVTQVSRWDRLKGFGPLLKGFVHLKTMPNGIEDEEPELHERRLDLVRLVLAGPDPGSIQDDPEGLEVFETLCARWLELEPALQRDIAIIVLPMASRRENALMVNALQSCSTIVVQNSLQEGFGLTASEAMWKRRPVLGTHAVGLREQIHDGVHGRLVQNPEDPEEVARTLNEMLSQPSRRDVWGRNGQRRVADQYLVFSQVRRWLETLSGIHVAVDTSGQMPPPAS